MMHNRDLERENQDWRFEIQKSVHWENKRSRKFGDIIINQSANVNDIMRSKMHEPSFSNF
jgi:hypothetical protein